MYDRSRYNLKIDLEKSHNSYLVDSNGKEYLDFFNQYSTNPLGYNHSIFDNEFFGRLKQIGPNKISNCEMRTDIGEEFYKEFTKYAGKDYKNFHFCCTGGLAVEAALKEVFDRYKYPNPIILGFQGAFHGITGMGMIATDKEYKPINTHISNNWPMIYTYHGRNILPPLDEYVRKYGTYYYWEDNNDGEYRNLEPEEYYKHTLSMMEYFHHKELAGMIIEPIQSTYGDRYMPSWFFRMSREFCDENDIPLIFDEVQTGFGTTGKMWYYEHCDIKPDIVIFGKKSQVSGIMTNDKIDYDKQEVTWDGNLIDMLRCIYIMKAMKRYGLLTNIRKRGAQLERFTPTDNINNLRCLGGLCAFDLDTKEERDKLVDRLFRDYILCNATRDKTIRLRLNLATTESEVFDFVDSMRMINETH